MKLFYKIIALFLFIFLLCIAVQNIFAQARFDNGIMQPSRNIEAKTFTPLQLQPAFFEGKYYVLVSFDRLPGEKTREELKQQGLLLYSYVPNRAYLASIEDKFNLAASGNFGIISIDPVPGAFKIGKDLLLKLPEGPSVAIAVSWYNTIGRDKVEKMLAALGATIVPTKFDKPGLMFIRCSKDQLEKIGQLPIIISLERQIIKDFPLNYNNNATHGNDALSYNGIGGRSLTGKGVTVGVGDDGNIASHIDFAGRLINRNGAFYSYHGTHTSGTTAGGGIVNQRNKGMSPKATLVSQYFSDVIVNAPTYFTDNNLTLTNNSYYSGDNNCPGDSKYDDFSNYIDAQTLGYDNILHVIAAGNDGALTCGVYPQSFATIKSGWQAAKNVITVGAIDNATNTVGSFSSKGPVKDGRLKPEIVAGGVGIISTIPYNTYGNDNGTSMAAPTVAGSLALLTQRYKQLNGNTNPKGYLLKALICNSAEDMGNPGPDFKHGFGKLNTRKSVENLEANRYFTGSVPDGATNQYTINIPAGVKQLKVMLYWPDKEAAANAAVALVNDLDITVTDPSSTTHLPLVLNNTPAGVNNNAVEGADHLNNIEQVVLNDPAAGNYTLSVNGYAVPFGPQPFAVTYDIITPGIFVEYPFGGETWVPFQDETIRWSAFDGDTNPFTIEYNDGSGWVTVDNNVAATKRNYAWVTPSTATNTARIRITRNITGITASSSFDFMVLGQPDVTATVPCDGYINLDWPAITSATGYDVYLLTGDSMQVVASTVSNTYLLKGMDVSKTYWVAVAAKNGAVTGRRSIAKSVVPASGVCTLSEFDNDLKAVAILEPVTARAFTANAALATKPIKVQIKNLDDVASTGSFDVSYSINGAPAVTETINPVIGAGAIYTHTFAQHSFLPGPFIDTIKVWVTKGADLQHANDTTYKIVKFLANPSGPLPFTEGFESSPVSTYNMNTTGLDGLDDADFYTNTPFGQARTFVNTGFAHSGVRAITLDQAPRDASSTNDSLLVTHNMSNFSVATSQLRLDFFYKNNGQDNLPGNKAWIRGSDTSQWVQAYDLFANQGGLGQYKAANGININELFGGASPQQDVSSSFQVKFGEQGYTSANSPVPIAGEDNGYTFDDIKISEAFNDVGLIKVVSPIKSGCGLTSSTPVTITIKNYNNATFNNISVGYKINNGAAVTQTIPVLNPYEVLTFTFATTADLSAYIDYSLDVWLNYPSDNYNSNDSITNYTFHNSPLISTYPYLERFESSDGNWYAQGTASSWQWGVPAGTIINKAASGSKAWVTNLSGNYNTNELSYLYSPCFDLSGLVQPELSFSHIFQLEDNCDCDYHWVEYSTDGGLTWLKLGAAGSGTNWYDNFSNQRWQLSKKKWHVASIDIPTNASAVRFRFVMSSDPGGNFEGVGIDDIHVFDKATIYTGPDVTVGPQHVSGNGWVDFNAGGNRVVSINPYGLDLGTTTVNAYFNTGAVRTSNNQYYLDRNIVIKPSVQPTQYVGVRFYFTDAEAVRLMNATGCGACTTIYDAYEAGVTKYSGAPAEENGTLADNASGFHQFILPANVDVIPYANGYYAEFGVNSFSEFWINNGGVGNIFPLPVSLLSFEAVKNGSVSKLTWITSQEINSDKFEIERSGNGTDFGAIGEIAASGNTHVETSYQFTDLYPLKGANYYRLRMVDRSGRNNNSLVRTLYFGNDNNYVSVYPNPVIDGTIYINTSAEATGVELFDIVGHRLKTFIVQGTTNRLSLGKLPVGVYQLKIITTKGTHMEKLNIQ